MLLPPEQTLLSISSCSSGAESFIRTHTQHGFTLPKKTFKVGIILSKYCMCLSQISSDFSLMADKKQPVCYSCFLSISLLLLPSVCDLSFFFFSFLSLEPRLSVTRAQFGWVEVFRVASTHSEQASPTKGYGMRQLSIHFHLSALNG